MKLHEEFKKKHNLNDDWMVEIMDSQYPSFDTEGFEVQLQDCASHSFMLTPDDAVQAYEENLKNIQIQGGYIATVHNSKTKEDRAYFVESGENLLMSEVKG